MIRTHLTHRVCDDRLVLEQHDDQKNPFWVSYITQDGYDPDLKAVVSNYNNTEYFKTYQEASEAFNIRRASGNSFSPSK